MLESELYDRGSDDKPAGGRGAGELSQSVPAAVFQPPQVVFQPPPAAPPEPAPRPERAPRSEPVPSSGSAGPADAGANGGNGGTGAHGGNNGNAEAPGGADEDGAGRRRRRRPSRSRARTGDQDGAADNGDAQPEGAEAPRAQDSAGDGGNGAAQPEGRRAPARTRSRRASAAKDVADPAADSEAAAGSAQSSGPAEGNGPDEGDDDGEGGSSARRRRRKRRRGSAEGGSDSLTPDDPPDTVVHVREPSANDDVRSVKGSTRLEAKKQRRREGRETGRRRPPIVTESEFLARRESVERSMVVRQRKDRTQIAVLEDEVLVEHYVNRSSQQSYVGNVYLGKVQNVLPSMEAAFVDIGKGRNAVLYAGEVNFDVSGLEGQPKRIESALKAGQSLIVQVTKDPVGHKGARLTSQVSLPGRYLVYVPGASMTGISRKLPDTERNRLKAILKRVMPENAGVIVRTAAEGAAEEELSLDVSRLAAQWEAIEKKAKTASAPALLYSEPDLTIRVIRDVFNEDFAKLVVSGDEAWDVVDEYVQYVAPHLADRISRWQGSRDVFADYRIDEQLAKALERKVWLPSGGSLVIDKTEAMTVVDVNTGKFTGQGGNLEETVTRNNLEAAEEIVRQLRLRDIGGIIVIDFIDMVLESNRDLVLRRLLECLARDRTKHQVAEVTSLGLVQMTRKRVGAGLLEAFSVPCECCNGRGVILTLDLDGDVQPAPHTHSRGNGGNHGGHHSGGGNGGGNAARTPAPATPASVAARARPADVQPADAQPADAQPADAQPAGAQPPSAQPATAQPPVTQPVGAQPPSTQPPVTQPVGTQPVGTQPVGTKPAGAGRLSTRPAGPPQIDSSVADSSTVSSPVVSNGAVSGQAASDVPVGGGLASSPSLGSEAAGHQPADGQPASGQPADAQSANGQPADPQTAGGQPAAADGSLGEPGAESDGSARSSNSRRRRRNPAAAAAAVSSATDEAAVPPAPVPEQAHDGAA
jgi:ribonuclease E